MSQNSNSRIDMKGNKSRWNRRREDSRTDISLGENEMEQYVCLLVWSFSILLESMLKIHDRYLENQAENEAIISWANNSRTKQTKIWSQNIKWLIMNNVYIIIMVNFKYWFNKKCWNTSVRGWRERKYTCGGGDLVKEDRILTWINK